MTLAGTKVGGNLEKYRVYSKREIASILRNLKDKRQAIRMVFHHSGDVALTSVLYLDPANQRVVLDRTKDEKLNQKILHMRNVKFEAILDKIKVFFTADGIQDCFFQDRPAFLIDLPEDMLRIQRREFYRVMTYRGYVRVPVETPYGMDYVKATLKDLSAGGVSISDESSRLDSEIGKIYHGCQLFLPDVQPITVSLQVRNTHVALKDGGKTALRLGCQFVEISHGEAALIQRWISRIERERLDVFRSEQENA